MMGDNHAHDGFECEQAQRSVPDGFVRDAVDALREWRGRNTPLSERDADQLRSRFARGPGCPAEHDDHGRNPHVRNTDAGGVAEFVAAADTALVELDDSVDYADYHAVPVGDDEYLPLVVTVGGAVETAARRLHVAFHGVEQARDQLTDSDAPVVTDGGEGERAQQPDDDSDAHLAEPSGRRFYPDGLKSREWWVNWVLAVRHEDMAGGGPDPAAKPTKQPVAPYDRGDAAPARWNETIPDEDHPRSSFDTVESYEGMQVGLDLPAPDRVVSDEVGIGIVQEAAAETDGRPITLLDWDDVRRPETGEIHPVCAWALDEADGFAEISQSGEGIHQFVYGEVPGGLRQFLRHVDDEPFVGDDRPMIEMYSGTRLTAMTGQHVAGCGDDLVDGQDLIDELCWRFGTGSNNSTQTPTDPFARKRDDDAGGADDGGDSVPGHAAVDKAVREAHEYDGDDPAEWDLDDDESIRYAAVLRAWELDEKPANVAHWQLMGYAAALGVQLGKEQAEVVDDLAEYEPRRRAEKEVRSVYRKAERGAVSAPSAATLQEKGLLPELDDDSARGGWGVETCTAPAVDRQSFDRRDHWAHLQGERFDETLAADGPVVWADPAGSGKTTNAARAAVDRDEPHYVSFQNHRKAREFQVDDATPDGYYHLRGGAQKRHDDCLDADHAGEDCPEHGDTGDCPHMCPVYDLDSDHPTRQLYDAVVEALGPVEAHLMLAEPLAAEAGHDDDGHCPWLNQFAEVANESRVVGVHEYLTLKTVRDPSDGPTRQVIVDEYAGAERVATDTELTVEKLTRADRFLDGLGATDTEREVFDVLAAFLRDVRDGVADDSVDDPLAAADDPTDNLAEIGDSRRLYVDGPDSDDVPDWATEVKTEVAEPDPGNDMARARHERYYVETDGVGELLARAAVSYREAVRTRYEHDPEGAAGVPYAADAVLAVVAATADPARGGPVRKAMNAPTRASTCPRCGSDLVRVADDPTDWSHVGGHDCEECGWNSDRHTYLAAVDRPARATAWVTSDADGTDTGVTVRRLPEPDSLPDDPLLLDATARPDPVAGLFDVSVDDVTVYGDEPAAYDGLEVTQVVDGQYHPGTLKRSESARERVATTLRKLGSAHGDVLVVGPKRLYTMFSEALPEGTEWLSYHATRGLNRAQYDAVVCVGAPHPRVADLRRNAGLLAQGHDDLRRGGEEHSTRRDARPPVYRRLDYRDDDGDGRAVPTKHYAGLTGELFQQSREDELVQAVHRIRPLLAEGDETNHAYLLTNVPTPLPVDTLATFDELAEPLRALLPVHDGALRLAEYVGEIEAGDGPDGFRATAFVEGDEWRVDELHRLAAANGETVGERQVRRWVDDLAEIGLLDAGSYEPRAGVPYEPADESTLTRALQVLRGDGGVEVALQRRFAEYLREAESLADWLGWARRNLAVTGEVERWATADSDGAPPG